MDEVPVSILVLHALGALGFAAVVTLGLICEPVRELWHRTLPKDRFPRASELLDCTMCFGFWAGAGWAGIVVLRRHLGGFAIVADMIAFAFAVSLMGLGVKLADHAVGGFGRIGKKDEPKP